VQNDLLKITPVMLTPTASRRLPKEGLENGSHPSDADQAQEERPAKKQKVEEDAVTPKSPAPYAFFVPASWCGREYRV
jgi:hypothetical protein